MEISCTVFGSDFQAKHTWFDEFESSRTFRKNIDIFPKFLKYQNIRDFLLWYLPAFFVSFTVKKVLWYLPGGLWPLPLICDIYY